MSIGLPWREPNIVASEFVQTSRVHAYSIMYRVWHQTRVGTKVDVRKKQINKYLKKKK